MLILILRYVAGTCVVSNEWHLLLWLLLTVRIATPSENYSRAWRSVCLDAWVWEFCLFVLFSLTLFPIEQVVGSVNDGVLRALLFRNSTQFLWSLPVTLHIADHIVTWVLVTAVFLGGVFLVVLTESVFLCILLVHQWGIMLMRSF